VKAQGINRDSFPWKSPFQPYTAWVGFIGATILALVSGVPVFLKGRWSASTFVASYISIPIFIVPIIVWKLIHRTKVSNVLLFIPMAFSNRRLTSRHQCLQFARASTIDLWSGRLQEGEVGDRKPPATGWKRILDWIF
jgi:amino acid transporter